MYWGIMQRLCLGVLQRWAIPQAPLLHWFLLLLVFEHHPLSSHYCHVVWLPCSTGILGWCPPIGRWTFLLGSVLAPRVDDHGSHHCLWAWSPNHLNFLFLNPVLFQENGSYTSTSPWYSGWLFPHHAGVWGPCETAQADEWYSPAQAMSEAPVYPSYFLKGLQSSQTSN